MGKHKRGRFRAAELRAEQERAYKLGEAAYGTPRPKNPFHNDTANWHAWNDGFEFSAWGGQIGKDILYHLRTHELSCTIGQLYDSISHGGQPPFTEFSRMLGRLVLVGGVIVTPSLTGRLDDVVKALGH